MRLAIKTIVVITGDASLPDPSKRDGSYHEEDALSHNAMMAASCNLPTSHA